MLRKRYGDPTIVVRLPQEEKERLQLAATQQQTQISTIVREAIKQYLDGREERENGR